MQYDRFFLSEYYQKCEIQFLGLANIHSIRYSFQKLRALCWESSETNWFQSLETCQWIYHLWALLASAVRVAEALQVDGRPVLVHCSDGWDRTTQIVSLAKLFLDPHYRTMKVKIAGFSSYGSCDCALFSGFQRAYRKRMDRVWAQVC